MPGMDYSENAVCYDSYQLTGLVTDFQYSWISNSFVDGIAGNTLFIFGIFWFVVLITIAFLNVGLASLLFLLEVGLFTPIASMAALNALPLSTILYFLNAITMEAVVGVIISLCYSRDWGHKDFTKYETLEGFNSLKTCNTLQKTN